MDASGGMEITMATQSIPMPAAPAMADAWFYIKNSTAMGPIPLAELVRVLKQRPEGGSHDLVWRAGFVGWLKAGEVLELAAHVPYAPPPPGYMAGEGYFT
jgi:uncharacterized protein DUF4339